MNYKLLIKVLSLFLLTVGWSVSLTAQVLAPKYEFRGVWVATVNNIDWPSKPGLSTAEQQKEAIEMLDLYRKLGMNAVILQVRPCSDAFYDSPLEPWSRYLTGTPGRLPNPYYDPLTFWINESHKRGMELHAWLNPYRVAQRADEPLAGNHQLFSNPEWVIRYDNKLLFDPGIPGTRDYVTNIVCDIVRRYEIDGIHMDDYFYPYPTSVPFPDEKSFALHNRAFPPTEKEGWRRENVDILIKTISDSIRSIKPWVRFGISPFGIWRNQRDDPAGSATTAGVTNYDHLYADIRKWLQLGWIDYVTPQIYFETGHRAADFETLCKWWNDNTFGRQLYIGLAPYKLDRNSSVQAWRSSGQLPTQLKIMRKYPNISGGVYFSGKQFKRDLFGFQDSLRNNYYRYPALIPPVRWAGMPLPPVPARVQVSGRKVSWMTPLAETELAAPTRYMVYLCEPGKPFDPATASSIVQVTPLTKAELRKISRKRRTWEVRITSLDRYNNESLPSDPVKIKL